MSGDTDAMAELRLESPAFSDGDPIPTRHTCEGDDVSPPLAWSGVREGTRSLALIVDDPDAPFGTFVHWTGWGIDPGSGGLEAGASPPVEGENGFGRDGYGGPCPPPGHGPHRYFHRLYALDAELDLEPGASREQLEDAIEGHVLAEARLVGTYERT
jgi:Raf kinase inhibitor-like YbhB/YbcL family protein